MHDGMPCDPIQGQGRGQDCLKATQEESTVGSAREYFLCLCLLCMIMMNNGIECVSVALSLMPTVNRYIYKV